MRYGEKVGGMGKRWEVWGRGGRYGEEVGGGRYGEEVGGVMEKSPIPCMR